MKKLLNRIKIHWSGCTLFILTAITALSLWPQETLPDVPGGDKIHHLISYTLLAFPTALRRPRHWGLLCLLFIVYGGLIELIQPYTNRYGEWLDFAANSTGILCGLLLAELLIRQGLVSAPSLHSRKKK
ncbi:MAG: VanZ family protein [Candidatus Electrothrix sp. EH2]|nr:VanZ family protein [Candidatus Electrothrix sp. EH2]